MVRQLLWVANHNYNIYYLLYCFQPEGMTIIHLKIRKRCLLWLEMVNIEPLFPVFLTHFCEITASLPFNLIYFTVNGDSAPPEIVSFKSNTSHLA